MTITDRERDERQPIVLDAANLTVRMASNDEFREMTLEMLQMVGYSMLEHLRLSDRGALFTPIAVQKEGGEQEAGAILALEDRAVVAWLAGDTTPLERLTAVIPFDSVRSFDEVTYTASESAREVHMLALNAAERWILFGPSCMPTTVFALLKGLVEGVLTPLSEDEVRDGELYVTWRED